MRKVVTSSRFEKRLVTFAKHHPELSSEVEKIIQILAVQDLIPKSLRPHKLAGVLAKCVAIRISYSFRLVFIRTNDELSLIDIGSHDDVYR
jgi:mRNA-degrading endonuclease YafQ of YafQ-DinJ toxin-antitoxin module